MLYACLVATLEQWTHPKAFGTFFLPKLHATDEIIAAEVAANNYDNSPSPDILDMM